MPIIEVSHLTKEYQLGHITSLKENVLNTFRRLGGKPIQKREDFKALDDVNFTIEEGEVVGIIGHNGAGKSTLLKHLANISQPTKGKVIVRGSVAPLIEVGAGVNPELTGRENIFLNGAILGIPKKIIQQKLDEIIDFSELEQFIDTPVKRYSSGMTVKLGFSIATSMEADILIVDEVLAVGDLAFQRKCFDRMEDLIKRLGKTVLLVSHNIRQVERISTRVILLDHGKTIFDGDNKKACNLYFEYSDIKMQDDAKKLNYSKSNDHIRGTGQVSLKGLCIVNEKNQPVENIKNKQNILVKLSIEVHKPLRKPVFAVGFHTTDMLYIATERSIGRDFPDQLLPGLYTISCRINAIPLLPGAYALRTSVSEGEISSTIFYAENLWHFRIDSDTVERSMTSSEGLISLYSDWQLNEN
jgi:ABC-type polysaccharide/polyol phosphate transport system ATPase subunit